MKQKLIFISTLLILNYFILGADYKINNETDTGFDLKITNNSTFQFQSVTYPDSISTFNIHDSRYKVINNHLEIPFWQYTIAMPTSKKPTVQITDLSYEKIKLNKPLTQDDFNKLKKIPLTKITDIGFLGLTPSCILIVNPILFENNRQEIKFLKSATISINYAENTFTKSAILPEHETTFYQSTFINKNAKYFKTSRKIPLSKIVEYPSGQWIKITITGKKNYQNMDNIYSISYEDLSNIGITEDQIDPNRIYIYSNSMAGRQLSDYEGIPVPENLIENSRTIENSEDNNFGPGNKILFYGRTTSGVDLNSSGYLIFSRNNFSMHNYYWLLIADSPGNPKVMPYIESVSATHNLITTETEVLERQEIESFNILNSGNDWYGKKFPENGTSQQETFTLPTSRSNYQTSIQVRLCGGSEGSSHSFRIYNGSTLLSTASSSDYRVATSSINTTLNSSRNIIKIDYLGNGEAYLDYIECRYSIDLKPENEFLKFTAPRKTAIIKYQLSNINYPDPIIYDISDPLNVKIQNTSFDNDIMEFKANNNNIHRSRYIITNNTKYLKPDNIESIPNPEWTKIRNNEYNADYIIITDESLISAAEDLAKIHNSEVKDGEQLSTLIVTQNQIMREFNGDIKDPNAIRFYLKYAFENYMTPPKYVLLLGDGTFDHRGIESDAGNLIMTYQVYLNQYDYHYYAADSRFTYINGTDKLSDIAIGRIPCRNQEEAKNAIDKIREYLVNPIYGTWRSHITLVADDPLRPESYPVTAHIDDSEGVAESLPKIFSFSKLYLLEYPQTQDASKYGVKKPGATEAILSELEKGTTIINYFGHGSPTQWAQEEALVMGRDLGLIKTGGKLPFWIAGTCTWGKFDEIENQCMPEALVLKEEDGAIAALGATRPTTSSGNKKLIKSIFDKWFLENNIRKLRVGEILQSTISGNTSNNEKYIYFGDPALYLALPYESATFSPLKSDTLKSLENIMVNGKIENLSDFSGEGYIRLFDSDRMVSRPYDNNRRSLSYVLPGQAIFKGLIDISNGEFSSKFFIPKDLNYAGRKGKIQVYGWNQEEKTEVGGVYSNIVFSGSKAVEDSIGPTITVFLDNNKFRDGDIINQSQVFNINIIDEHGINLAGRLGHNINVVFDNNSNWSDILTSNFSYEKDSDTSGYVSLEIPWFFQPGDHSFTLQAWDNANNLSKVTYDFTLSSNEKFALSKVVNYPNPFTKDTDITFYISEPCEITISIYTVNGQLIKKIDNEIISTSGFHFIKWDGKDDFSDNIARGIYFYKIEAKSILTDDKVNHIGKMVKS